MFAIAFDMDIKELRNAYGEPYNNAYYEIKIILRRYDFYNTQGSVTFSASSILHPPAFVCGRYMN